jgi:hypothetical protein
MRVVNFAKSARLSHDHSLEFWKMFGISVANLAVRVIGDIKALFGSFFAGTPRWDGTCESLRFPYAFSYIGSSSWFQTVRSYPWASAFRKPHERTSFLGGFRDGIEQEEGSQKDVVYPHLWCILAKLAKPSAHDNLTSSNFSFGKDPERTMTIPETCQTVLHVKRELAPEDSVRKDNSSSRCVVEGGDWPGSLWSKLSNSFVNGDECNKAIADELHSNDFCVAKRVIEVLPECEIAAFPRAFHNLFPVLVARAARLEDQLSAFLRKTNACLHETINHASAAMGVRLDHEITCRDAEVRANALGMVHLVREFLWELGASWPKDGHKEDKIPRRQSERQQDDHALMLRLMWESFDIKLGLEGLQRKLRTSSVVVEANANRPEEESRNVVANRDAEIKTLNGIWWQDFNRSKTLKLVLLNRNPFLAARFFAVAEYAPPVTVSIGVTLSARAVSSRFCERKPSLLETHFTLMRKWHTFSPMKKTRMCVNGKASFNGVTGHARCCRVHNTHGELEYELSVSASLVAAEMDMSTDMVPLASTLGLAGLSGVAAMLTGKASATVNTPASSQLAMLHQGMQSKLMMIASVGLITNRMFAPVIANLRFKSMHDAVHSVFEGMEKTIQENPNELHHTTAAKSGFGIRGEIEVEVELEKVIPFKKEEVEDELELESVEKKETQPANRKTMFVNALSRASTPAVGMGGHGLDAGATLSCFVSWDVTNVLFE